MICLSIAESDAAACIDAMDGRECAEIRIDMLERPDEQAIRSIFSSSNQTKKIATCRPGKIDERARSALLVSAMEAGAAMVDIEVESSDGFKRMIAESARKNGCQLIVSYHNNEKTPGRAELEQIIEWCFSSGADIAKIACTVTSDSDNARLLGLLESRRRLIVIGMGMKGRITRIVAPLLGSVITFASLGPGKETAEGQLDADAIGRIQALLGEGR